MVLKSIGVFSLAKMMAALYAVGGFIAGAFLALLGILGPGIAAAQSDAGAFIGMLFGVGAIMAFVYNLVAGIAGGVELELE